MTDPDPPTSSSLPRFDRHEVVRRLHFGPVAETFEARQLPLGRQVVIKALRPTILPTSPFAQSIEREAKLLSELAHPNIVRLYDYVRTEETMWLVLEHMDGVSLADVIARGPLSARTAIAVAQQVARGLAHAHHRGIVHRDVQPANVLVAQSGRVKLAGFAAASDGRLPTAPEPLEVEEGFGSPRYLSPEQVLGERTDARSDLFALGVVLYEMLSGTRPFDAVDGHGRAQRGRYAPLPPVSRGGVEVSAKLERIIRRCLEQAPGDRFGSAAELEQALKAAAVELGDDAPEHCVAEALVQLGLAPGAAQAHPPQAASSAERRLHPAVGGVLGHLVALAVFSVAAVALHHRYRGELEERQRRSGSALELAPQNAAYLQVVADPWAHVQIEGHQVATTPFAQPIPLAPGLHHVRLVHPNAPSEDRAVRLAAGETRLLDVTMQVVRPAPPTSAPPPDALAPTP